MHVLIRGQIKIDGKASKRLRRSVWALAVMGLVACHANPHVPAIPRGMQQVPAAASASGPDVEVGAQVHLGVTDLRLPTPSAQTTLGEQQFYAAATRAVRHVYEDDIDDPSQLLALRQRLSRDPNLRSGRIAWQPILETSLARAQTLRTLGPTLRALRQALANSWRDEITRSYRDIDQAGCRVAAAAMPVESASPQASLQETVVTIEPLGAYPLRTLFRLCDDARFLYGHE